MKNKEIVQYSRAKQDYSSVKISTNFEQDVVAKYISPEALRSARNLLMGDDYVTQEIVIKSFTEFDMDKQRFQS
jgi:hypothetical protein